jgi:hypothetical protein
MAELPVRPALRTAAAIGESQRDSVLQPRVAAGYPGCDGVSELNSTPTGLRQDGRRAGTPLGLKRFMDAFPRVGAWRQPWA